MSLKFILKKYKNKNQINYKLIVSNIRKNKRGNTLDIIGQYIYPVNKQQPKQLIINKHKFNTWLLKGALPNKKVKNLLIKAGII